MNEAFERYKAERLSRHIDANVLVAVQSAFEYAYTAGLIRAAEIANSMTIDCPSNKCPQYVDMDDCMYKETGFCISAAIRKEAEGV